MIREGFSVLTGLYCTERGTSLSIFFLQDCYNICIETAVHVLVSRCSCFDNTSVYTT